MSNIPSRLGPYEIIREIARSNDIVYEAYDPVMNRRVAVKELSVPNDATETARTDRILRFKREAKASGTLNHPNIMTVHSFAEDGDRLFLAMEFLDGTSLRTELDRNGFLSEERAIEIAKETLAGLEHAHARGVVHRDIKPDNLQILANGQVKITDFGIARLTFQPNITIDGQVFGTPSYMAPEQILGRDADARCDLFSLGVVLYEMIAGTKPFKGDNVVAIGYAIASFEPEKPTACSDELWEVIERAISKKPEDRFADAAEMREALLSKEEKEETTDDAPATKPAPVKKKAAPTKSGPVYNPYAGLPIPDPITWVPPKTLVTTPTRNVGPSSETDLLGFLRVVIVSGLILGSLLALLIFAVYHAF